MFKSDESGSVKTHMMILFSMFMAVLLNNGMIQASETQKNYGFENGKNVWQISKAVIESGKDSGKSYLHVKLTKTESEALADGFSCGAVMRDDLPVAQDKVYVVNCNVKGNGILWLHAWCYDENKKFVGDIEKPGNGEHRTIAAEKWQPVSMIIEKFPSTTRYIRLCLEVQRQGAVDVIAGDVTFDVVDSAAHRHPEAVINLAEKTVHLGQWVKADGKASKAEKGNRIVFYEWGYGDLNGKEMRYDWFLKVGEGTYEHRPMMVGGYYLTLKVTDNMGNRSLTQKTKINVLPNNPPRAEIQYKIVDGKNVEFDGGKSVDPDGDKIVDWRWELPNGKVQHGRKITYVAEQLSAFRAGLIVTDQWGLEGQKEIDVDLDASPLNFKPTLQKGITLTIKDDAMAIEGLDEAGMVVPVRLGFNEYLPIRIINASSASGPVTVMISEGEEEGGKNTWIRPLKVSIESGKEFSGVLELKTILNVNHKVEMVCNTGRSECKIPLTLQVVETYPIFGTQEHFTRRLPGLEQGLRDMTYLDELPCQIYRLPDVLCWFIQKKDGEKLTYDFNAADWSVKNITEKGKTKILPFLGYIPGWLQPLDVGLDAKLPYWRAYVKAVVQRYAKEVDYWESYNEPPWGGVEDWGKNGPEMMFKLMKNFYEVVKEEDPTAKVVAPGWTNFNTNRKTVERIIEMGGDPYVDIYNFHDYTLLTRLGLGELFDATVQNLPAMRHVALLQKHNIKKPLFITEAGGSDTCMNEKEMRIKAIQWLRTNLIWLNAGVKGIFEYEFYDYPHDFHPPTFGVMRYIDHYKLPYFTATREIIRSMTGATCVASEGKVPQANVKYAIFEKEHETIVGIWSCVPYQVVLTTKVPEGQVIAIEDKGFSYSGDVFFTTKKMNVAGTVEAAIYNVELSPYQVRIITFVKKDTEKLPVKVEFKSGHSPIRYEVSESDADDSIRVEIMNLSDQELSITTRLGSVEKTCKLLPKQSCKEQYQKKDYRGVLEIEYHYMEKGIQQEGFESVPVRKSVRCLRLQGKSPTIDGDICEYATAVPVELINQGGLTVAQARFMWNEKGLYLAAEVNKASYYQPNKGNDIFQGDSIQFAVDSDDDKNMGGYDGNDYEFGFTKLADGRGFAFCWKAEATRHEGERKDISVAVRVSDGKTYYEVLIPWSVFVGFTPGDGGKMGFDLLVNINDGDGRKYTELTPGIGGTKCPFFYSDLILTEK